MNKDRKAYFKRYYQLHKEKIDERTRRWKEEHKEQEGTIDIYQSREELKQWEIDNNTHCINWDIWDKVQEQTKQDITKALKDHQEPLKRKPIYVYTLNTKIPLIVFKDSDEAATTLDINRMIVTNHARTQVPIYYKGIILSYTPINETED